ncbi:WD repeat-containing protein 31 isoform X1 [Hydra vulgaris]|uniref:WD repeat-containing protein 31 isoform X1 n=1 Tax=Hydra vulgaris TaxID=6087 RepID=UPI001F5F010A|nr:WD repeat-containing protein 31 isoform X1 [Hydra vulgaris]
MGKKQSKQKVLSTERSKVIQHYNPVTSLDFYQEYVLAANSVGNIDCYDVESKNKISQYSPHQAEVTQVVSHPSHIGFFSSSRDKVICFNSFDTQVIQKYEDHKLVVTALSTNQDGTQMVSGSRDCTVKLWDVSTKCVLKSSSIAQNMVTDIKWSHENNLIFQSSEDRSTKLMDPKTLFVVSCLPKKNYFQTCLDVSSFNLVTGSTGCNGTGCELVVWDIRQLKSLYTIINSHAEKLTDCKFLKTFSNDTCIVTSSLDSTIKVWESDLSASIDAYSISTGKGVTSLAVSMTLNRIAVGTFEYGLHMFDFTMKKFNPLYIL